MPWVATDSNGQVCVYEHEPVWFVNEFRPEGSDWFKADGFPNPPKPGEKRQFSFSEFVLRDETPKE